MATFASAAEKPEWCQDLPRPVYKRLERVSVPDSWFEVYRIRPGVFAIYEPKQSEEVISYLIVGQKRALLFDTGMGISNIKKLAEGLTSLPLSVLNSHTHNDHVGDNWRFSKQQIYGMDTVFTRAPVQKVHLPMLRRRLQLASFAVHCRQTSMPNPIPRGHFRSGIGSMMATALTWVGAWCR